MPSSIEEKENNRHGHGYGHGNSSNRNRNNRIRNNRNNEDDEDDDGEHDEEGGILRRFTVKITNLPPTAFVTESIIQWHIQYQLLPAPVIWESIPQLRLDVHMATSRIQTYLTSAQILRKLRQAPFLTSRGGHGGEDGGGGSGSGSGDGDDDDHDGFDFAHVVSYRVVELPHKNGRGNAAAAAARAAASRASSSNKNNNRNNNRNDVRSRPPTTTTTTTTTVARRGASSSSSKTSTSTSRKTAAPPPKKNGRRQTGNAGRNNKNNRSNSRSNSRSSSKNSRSSSKNSRSGSNKNRSSGNGNGNGNGDNKNNGNSGNNQKAYKKTRNLNDPNTFLIAKDLAPRFHAHLCETEMMDRLKRNGSDREELGLVFQEFYESLKDKDGPHHPDHHHHHDQDDDDHQDDDHHDHDHDHPRGDETKDDRSWATGGDEENENETLGSHQTNNSNGHKYSAGHPKPRLLESYVMMHMRRQRLLRTINRSIQTAANKTNGRGELPSPSIPPASYRSLQPNRKVLVTIAGPGGSGDFPPPPEMRAERDRFFKLAIQDETDKRGISVSRPSTDDLLVEVGNSVHLDFNIATSVEGEQLYLSSSSLQFNAEDVSLPAHTSHKTTTTTTTTNTTNTATTNTVLEAVTIVGRNSSSFRLETPAAHNNVPMELRKTHRVSVIFTSSATGVYQATLRFEFRTTNTKNGEHSRSSLSVSSNAVQNERDNADAGHEDDHATFRITRPIIVKSGNAALYDLLKPVAPYTGPRRNTQASKDFSKASPDAIVPAPALDRQRRQHGRNQEDENNNVNPLAHLKQYFVPQDVRGLIENGELRNLLQRPDETSLDVYGHFWQHLLWAQEVQAAADIQIYDMENVRLQREGQQRMALRVPGLAEGRPSVLRGDTIRISFRGTTYLGRVEQTRDLDVVLLLSPFFLRAFDPALDTVSVRFQFSRTTFRTCHAGSLVASKSMGETMLSPTLAHGAQALKIGNSAPSQDLKWANRTLNREQREAVLRVVQGSSRPLPYLIFGPPGTGKTTTVAEAVYQLAQQDRHRRILLVAPSNDAADILVEKLQPHFPPSEMRRVLAYSRSLALLSPTAQSYAKEGLDTTELVQEVLLARIVVSTVNLAARLGCFGVPRGHFDVLCVDEAGHATEPEVVAVASTLMDFGQDDDDIEEEHDDDHGLGRGRDRSPSRRDGNGQLILAGDPKQLGPVITSELCRKFGMTISFMERLSKRELYLPDKRTGEYPCHLITMLRHNYRSHPDILKLPNEMFYDSQLTPAGDVLATYDMCRWEYLPKQGFPILFHAVHGENLREEHSPSWFNPQEAQEVINYVDKLVNQTRPPVSPEDIGVITPYARQAQKIRKALASSRYNIQGVKVGSVETFQGQERRCIIVSTVRAESEYLSLDIRFNLGFVANEKRFNVALTRAKSLIVVIGNPQVLELDQKNWLPFLRYCRDNESWVGQTWEEGEGIKELKERQKLAEEEEKEELQRHGDGGGREKGERTAQLAEFSISSSLGAVMDEEWEFLRGPSAKSTQEEFAFLNHEE